MPVGSANFALAAVVLALKLFLIPRALPMPAFALYLVAGCVTTSSYLLGWQPIEAAWMPVVAILGVLAAIESTRWALGLQSDEERAAVSRWCVLFGLVVCASQRAGGPAAYPQYPELVYEIRLTATAFGIGYLAALLGFCFAASVGVKRYVIHAAILLVRLGAVWALLLVPHRLWFPADLAGGAVNALTLCAWLWLLPRRRRLLQGLH